MNDILKEIYKNNAIGYTVYELYKNKIYEISKSNGEYELNIKKLAKVLKI